MTDKLYDRIMMAALILGTVSFISMFVLMGVFGPNLINTLVPFVFGFMFWSVAFGMGIIQHQKLIINRQRFSPPNSIVQKVYEEYKEYIVFCEENNIDIIGPSAEDKQLIKMKFGHNFFGGK